jgi:hypothetical protein
MRWPAQAERYFSCNHTIKPAKHSAVGTVYISLVQVNAEKALAMVLTRK